MIHARDHFDLVNGHPLSDAIINAAQKLLLDVSPNVQGLQPTFLS